MSNSYKASIQDANDVDDFEFDLPEIPPSKPVAATSGSVPQYVSGQDAEATKRCAVWVSMLRRVLTCPSMHRWTVIYPIFLDAKRPKKTGQRRVGKEHAVEWPLAREMAFICGQLGFKTHLEVGLFPSAGIQPLMLAGYRWRNDILLIGRTLEESECY